MPPKKTWILPTSYHTNPKDNLVEYLDNFIAAQKLKEKVAANSRVILYYIITFLINLI
jgi:hypothetical protein